MTRLLYNLYRQNQAVPQTEKTRVINSNRLIEEKLEEWKKEQRKAAGGEFIDGLPAEEIQEEEEPGISLEEIQAEADRIIAEANDKAGQILEDAKIQISGWQAQAEEDGYADGHKRGMDEMQETLAAERKKLEAMRTKLEAEYEQKYRELEPQLLENVLTVVERVFHAQFDNRKDILLALVQDTVEDIESAKEFRIRLTPENCSFLKAHAEEIEMKIGMNSRLEFVPDTGMGPNECLIETDSGVFDCSLDVQLNNLIHELRKLQ